MLTAPCTEAKLYSTLFTLATAFSQWLVLGVRRLGMQVVDGEQSVTSARVKASIDEGSRTLIHQCGQPSMELKNASP